MKNAVLLSINPKWCEKIAQKVKKIEIRKTEPKLKTPFKCYIYCTKDRHYHITADGTDVLDFNKLNIFASQTKVIGEFVCDKIYFWQDYWVQNKDYIHICDLSKESCVPVEDILKYAIDSKDFCVYGWHISELKIYDKPKELSEFYIDNFGDKNYNGIFIRKYLSRPPQSWCYVEEI